MFGKIFCRCHLHRFEKEPSIRGKIACIGEWFLFDIGIQNGSCKCLRAGCSAMRAVTRTGFVGVGVPEPEWKAI